MLDMSLWSQFTPYMKNTYKFTEYGTGLSDVPFIGTTRDL